MKMEMQVCTPSDGQCVRILVKPGQLVDAGEVVAFIKPSVE